MSLKTLNTPVVLEELSRCDRMGLKGRCATEWLKAQGLTLPDVANRWHVGSDGMTVARYADNEYVLADFSQPVSSPVAEIRQALENSRPQGCYSVPRADSQVVFKLSGAHVMDVLSALCPADVRERAFQPGDVLQTICAGVSAQIWNVSVKDHPQVIILCDVSVGHHQREALGKAIHESTVARTS